MTKFVAKEPVIQAWRAQDLLKMSEKREPFPEPVEELFQKGQLLIYRCPNMLVIYPGGSRTMYTHHEDWLIFDNGEWSVMSPFRFENKYRKVEA